MIEPAVQVLLDKQAIYELMVRYTDRIDANDPEGAASCFAPDGIGMYGPECKGRKAISDLLGDILLKYQATSHYLSNVSIKVDGDRATAMSYIQTFHRVKETRETMFTYGRWLDDLVRLDGEWLFARREVRRVGSINYALGDFVHPGHPGRLDRGPFN
jgi:uncharacterized protein (TIGR02246 family)